MDSHSAVAISRAAWAACSSTLCLANIGDLVGERLDFGSDRQRHLAGDADGFLVQLRNPRRGVGATACRGDRFTAHSRDLLGCLSNNLPPSP